MLIKTPIIQVEQTEMHILNMRTRFPFQYGIASLTAIPHLFIKVEVNIEGMGTFQGLTSEGLPPKWFTKNPDTTFEEDLPAFFEVINFAFETAKATKPGTWFQLWQEVYNKQQTNNWSEGVSPLLANLGVALVERATVDAICRGMGMRLHQTLTRNYLGIDLAQVREGLTDIPVDQPFIHAKPFDTVHVRHTVGLGDPLTEADTAESGPLDDGLPYTLEENIREYGLEWFKIKLCGDPDTDFNRLWEIADLLRAMEVKNAHFTMDGNEQFKDLEFFKYFFEGCQEDDTVREFFDKSLVFVEQPFHRDIALSTDLREWEDRPHIVLDESDQDLDSLPKALELGYQGCSFKNCKGIVKGLANAALLAQYRSKDPHGSYILSGEDLANVGPIALNQDLAMVASLGIRHVERNGHHYFRGLSMFPEDMWDEIVEPGLFRIHDDGFPTLAINNGDLDLRRVTRAPFGANCFPETEKFTPVADWSPDSLGI